MGNPAKSADLKERYDFESRLRAVREGMSLDIATKQGAWLHFESPRRSREESIMKITSRQVKGVVILDPEGKITLGDGDQELGEAVRQTLENGARKIVINFSKVSYLDSSGVGELVGCYTSIKNKHGELRICGLNARIFGLIKMTSLHSVFEVKDTEEEALAGF